MTEQIIKSAGFVYDGTSRIVDNITDEGNGIITGFEMRKSGKFSYKIKRFRKDKIDYKSWRDLPPQRRSGPALSRP